MSLLGEKNKPGCFSDDISTFKMKKEGEISNKTGERHDKGSDELRVTKMRILNSPESGKKTLDEISEIILQRRKKDITVGSTVEKKFRVTTSKKKTEVEKTKKGFGWKGLGSLRIVFDDTLKDYLYEVIEPKLNEEETQIKNEITHLFKMLVDVNIFEMNVDEKLRHLEEMLQKIIVDNHIVLKEEAKDKIFYYIFQGFVGYGKIDILMHDEDIEDISCNGHEIPVFIYHRKYDSIKTNIVFTDNELDSFVVKLAQICGKQISIYEPIIDGKLPDGSRLSVTLAKTVTTWSTFTIRRFRSDPLTPIDLISNNTMSVELAAYFWLAIEHGSSILFCGGTAAGKTSALNALSLFIPYSYKIVSIEDTREVNLPHENWIAGTTRSGFTASEKNKTDKDIDMFDLIRAALRQRPRVIIVGEVRGREAYNLFQAMATGHISYSTVHASTIHELIQRLENPPISLPRALLTSLDIIVFLNSVTVGERTVRRITSVTEIIKLDPDTNQLIFMNPFSWVSKIDDRFENEGASRIIHKIKTENGWDDDRLTDELSKRILVLEWMQKNNIRSYCEVGKIISEFSKDSETVLKKARGA
jgi:flagellar protein FlaI